MRPLAKRFKKYGHRLTRRDLLLLQWIDRGPWNICERLRLELWAGKKNNHHYRRLRILEKLGLIRSGDRHSWLGRRFLLTLKARRMLRSLAKRTPAVLANPGTSGGLSA